MTEENRLGDDVRAALNAKRDQIGHDIADELEKGVPHFITVSNRVSIECDIPLDLAKAMLISMSGLAPDLKRAATANDVLAQTRLATVLMMPYITLADLLQLPQERVKRAVDMTAELYGQGLVRVLNSAVAAVRATRAKR